MRMGISVPIFWSLRLPPRPRALLALVTNFLALGFVGLMIWQLWLHADVSCLRKATLTQSWRVPLWPVAFAAAFGSLFLLTGVLLQLIARLDDPQRRTSAGTGGRAGAARYTE